MALAGTVLKKYKLPQLLLLKVQLVASGNYATGGDVFDFATIDPFTNRQPIAVIITGQAGFIYSYDLVNKKMLVFVNTAGGANTALGEHTAVGYVAGILADTIIATVLIAY